MYILKIQYLGTEIAKRLSFSLTEAMYNILPECNKSYYEKR